MDKNDLPVDVQKLLNGPMKELKPLFRQEFGKSLMLGSSNEFSVKGFKHGAIGMFISLYGFDEIFEALPESVTEIYIQGERGEDLNLVLPDSISKFKNLKALTLNLKMKLKKIDLYLNFQLGDGVGNLLHEVALVAL